MLWECVLITSDFIYTFTSFQLSLCRLCMTSNKQKIFMICKKNGVAKRLTTFVAVKKLKTKAQSFSTDRRHTKS